MNIQHLLPALAAVVGFGVAWVVKPAPPAPQTTADTVSEPTAGNPRIRPETGSRDAASGKRPEEVSASDFPLADQAEQGPQTRIEAKMNRLSEALGLSLDQQTEVIAAVEQARSRASDEVPVIEDFTRRGNELLETLKGIMTSEQWAAFEAVRERERDNLIEARAQNRLTKVITEIDLSPGQRDELLARLKQYERTQIQEVPAAATLLLKSSILPTEQTDLTIDGVLMLTRMAEVPQHPDDIRAAHQAVLEQQRSMLEEELRCFDGILTPGQMGQYHAMLSERKEIMKSVERNSLEGGIPTREEKADPKKLYGDPAPDPTRESPDEDLDEEETYDPEDDLEEDAGGNPVGS